MTGYSGLHLLGPHHRTADFRCGDEALDDWLRHRAGANQASGASRTWVATDQDDRVVGFYASSTAVVFRADATPRAARNQPDPVPALLLGRLAVHRDHQGAGLGAALLKHFLLKSLEVAQITGVRVLLVHAANDRAASFYRHHGFEPSPLDQLTLMLPLPDLTSG